MSTGQYQKNNTIIGDDAMADAFDPSASIGFDNTAYGFNALKNIADNVNENSAFGSQALESAFGGENSAFGAYAGAEIGIGSENALFGNWAGRFVGGKSNTACGHKALAGDMESDNIPGPLFATGGFNTAIGAGAMRHYPNGDDNVAVGYNAMIKINNGDNNTAIGSGAGSSITSGNNNTFIGKGADASGANQGNAQQRTAIGAGALADTDNTIILGTGENVGIGITDPDSQLHVQIKPLPELPRPAIHGVGIPGILAEGSVPKAYAIHAKGSTEAPAIYAEGGTGTGVPAPGAPAIYAKGPSKYPAIYAEATGAAAVYAQGSATDPGIQVRGTESTVGLFAEGSPGIYAQKIGTSQQPAIYAKGSEGGHAIKAETSGTVATIYAKGDEVPAIKAVGSGSTPVIHVKATGTGPAINAVNTTSGFAIQADGNGSDPAIEVNGSGSGPAIQAIGTTGYAIQAESSSAAAIYATGSPGIYAVSSGNSVPAIHAVGSATAPGIRVEGSGGFNAISSAAIYASSSLSSAIYARTDGIAAAICAEGSASNAIYAKTNGTSPAIHAVGGSYTSLSSPGPALFVDGGFGANVRILTFMSAYQFVVQIYPDDHILIVRRDLNVGGINLSLALPCPPEYQVQDGQMFIIKCWAKVATVKATTKEGYTIAQNGSSSTTTTTSRLINPSGDYSGGVTYVFHGGIYYEMVSIPYNA